MTNFIAALMRKAQYHLISWWPSLLKKEEGDKIVKFPMVPLDLILRNFINERHVHRTDPRTRGLALIKLFDAHHYFDDHPDYDEDVLLEGVIYLIASFPDFFEKMKKWLEDNGYDLGEFDE